MPGELCLESGWTVKRPDFTGLRDALIKLTTLDHADQRDGLTPDFTALPLFDAEERLAALTERVHHDLNVLLYPKDPWVLPRQHSSDDHVYDVLVVGGGQCGLTIGHALLQEKIHNFLILDRAAEGAEGPWITYSRMWTLRSPKHVGGPELGMPSLGGRSWFEAVYGLNAWQQLDKWPRQLWHCYLAWFRSALNLPVQNNANVVGFEMDGDAVRVTTANGQSYLARKVVLATGIEGMGDWFIPDFVRENLPQSAYTLCTDDVDSLAWRGQRIALLGAGATGWDRAADLLELGAKSVTMYMRREKVLTANAFRYLEKAGYLRHFATMPDDMKWRWIQTVFTYGQPPTQDGVNRCAHFAGFSLRPGATWIGAELTGEGIRITASDGSSAVYDHLFIGCGFSVKAHNRPELRAFADNILLWKDVYEPPEDQPDNWLIAYPYLTKDLRFQEREPGKTPVLDHIYCFNYGATVTNAHSGGSLSGLRYGLPPLIHGLTYALWLEDENHHFEATRDWDQIDTDPAPLTGHIIAGPDHVSADMPAPLLSNKEAPGDADGKDKASLSIAAPAGLAG